MNENKEEHTFKTRKLFRNWLVKNNTKSNGIWIVFTKGYKGFTGNDALEEAICFGWIDGVMKSIDGETYKKYFSKRKDKSNWSDKNIQTYKNLKKMGQLTQAGIEAFKGKESKQDKSALYAINIETLKRALVRDKSTLDQFEKITPSRKKQLSGFYCDAKTDETRNKRIKKIKEAILTGYKGILY